MAHYFAILRKRLVDANPQAVVVVVVGALPHLIHAIHLARLVVNTAHLAIHLARLVVNTAHLAIHFAVAMVALFAVIVDATVSKVNYGKN